MLGVILLYVGMVLMSNGLHRLEGIPDKSNVVMNIFTGGLGLILNIIVIAYGACTGQGAEWFYGSATGLLFAFTYLYSAINKDIKGLWIDTDCFWSVVIKLHITLSQVTRILNRKNNLIQTNFFFDTMIISILRDKCNICFMNRLTISTI